MKSYIKIFALALLSATSSMAMEENSAQKNPTPLLGKDSSFANESSAEITVLKTKTGIFSMSSGPQVAEDGSEWRFNPDTLAWYQVRKSKL